MTKENSNLISSDASSCGSRIKSTARKSTGKPTEHEQRTIAQLNSIKIKIRKLPSRSSNRSTQSTSDKTSSRPRLKTTCRKSTTRPSENALTSSYKMRGLAMSAVQKQSIRDPVIKTALRLHDKINKWYSTGPQRYGQGIGKGGIKIHDLAAHCEQQRRQQEQQHRRKQTNPKQRRSDQLDRITNYDRPKKSIPRGPFLRLIRDIIRDIGGSSYKIQYAALDALHETAEGYLVSLFDTCSLLVSHAGRVTLFPKDIDLAQRVTKQGNYEAPLH